LKPPENHVHIWSVGVVNKLTLKLDGSSEPSEKQKEVALSDALFLQMRLRCANRAEAWSPSPFSREHLSAQIRVEMDAITASGPPMGQILYDPT
jgi:hypothetical protein